MKIELTQDMADKLGLTGEIIEQLEGFVEFVEVGA